MRAFCETGEKARIRLHQSHIADHGLDENCSEPIADAREMRVHIGEVVVARDREIVRDRRWNARLVRRVRMRRRARILQREIEVPVIIPGKLQHRRATRERTRHANRTLHGLATRRCEAQPLHRGQMSANAFGQHELVGMRRSGHRTTRGNRIESGRKRRMAVAEQKRTVGHHVVDRTRAVRVVTIRTRTARGDVWRTADNPARADRRTRAAGQCVRCYLMCPLRLLTAVNVEASGFHFTMITAFSPMPCCVPSRKS